MCIQINCTVLNCLPYCLVVYASATRHYRLSKPKPVFPDSLIPDSDPAFKAEYQSESGSRVLGPIIYLQQKKLIYFWSKISIYYPWASIQDVQATGEAEKPSSKDKFQHFKTWNFWTFFYYCTYIWPSWIRIQIPNPDPLTWLNPVRNTARNLLYCTSQAKKEKKSSPHPLHPHSPDSRDRPETSRPPPSVGCSARTWQAICNTAEQQLASYLQ